jgi:hypothetical protein
MSRAITTVLTALLLLFLTTPADAQDQSRVALVIGNGAYRTVGRLANPANDARAMAEILRRLRFDVVPLIDGDRAGMRQALIAFRSKLGADGVALLYYAGHGIQVRGKNYLIPVDADITSENDVPLTAMDLDFFQQEMQDAGVRLSLFVLDACRDNPFERRFRSAGSRGLAAVDAARGTLIAFATAPGKTAADGAGEHGIYTGELLKVIVKPGLTLENVLKETAANVERVTNKRQTPWYNSSFHGEFVFNEGSVNDGGKALPGTVVAAAPRPPSTLLPTATPAPRPPGKPPVGAQHASIEITTPPPEGEGPSSSGTIAGRTSNAFPDRHRVVIYAFTNKWWVQPTVTQPFTALDAAGRFRARIQLGYQYAAFLIEGDYRPPPTLDDLPPIGGPILDIATAAAAR